MTKPIYKTMDITNNSFTEEKLPLRPLDVNKLNRIPFQSYSTEEMMKCNKLQDKEKFEWIRSPLKIKVFLNHIKDSMVHNLNFSSFLKYLFSFYKYNGLSDFVIKHNVKINRMRSIIKYLEIKDLERKMSTMINRNHQRFKEDSMNLYRNEANEEFYIKLNASLKEKIINANRQSV